MKFYLPFASTEPISQKRSCYIWVETVCYIIGAVILILFWTVEKNLPEEQKAIKERSKK